MLSVFDPKQGHRTIALPSSMYFSASILSSVRSCTRRPAANNSNVAVRRDTWYKLFSSGALFSKYRNTLFVFQIGGFASLTLATEIALRICLTKKLDDNESDKLVKVVIADL